MSFHCRHLLLRYPNFQRSNHPHFCLFLAMSVTKSNIHRVPVFTCKHYNWPVTSFPICQHTRLKIHNCPCGIEGKMQLIPNCDWEKGLSYMGTILTDLIWVNKWVIHLTSKPQHLVTNKQVFTTCIGRCPYHTTSCNHYLFYWFIWIQKVSPCIPH